MTLPPTVGSAPLEGLTFGTRDMVQAGHSKCREMLRSLASQTRMQFGDCLRGGWALHLNNSAPLLSAWEERIETDTNILVFRMMDLGHSIAACLFRYLARNVAMLSQIWRFNEPHFTSKHQLHKIWASSCRCSWLYEDDSSCEQCTHLAPSADWGIRQVRSQDTLILRVVLPAPGLRALR